MENRYETLPMLVLRGIVCFPETVMHFDVGRLKSVSAINACMKKDQRIFLVAQKNLEEEDPEPSGLHRMGVVARVQQILKLPHDHFRIIVEGEYRASVAEVLQHKPHYMVVTQEQQDKPVAAPLMREALVRECQDYFEQYSALVEKMAPDVVMTILTDSDLGHLTDYIASNLPIPPEDKQHILNLLSVRSRAEALLRLLDKECQLLELEKKIEAKVQKQMDDN